MKKGFLALPADRYMKWVVYWGDCGFTTDTRTVAVVDSPAMVAKLREEQVERGEEAFVHVLNGQGRSVSRFRVSEVPHD